MDELNCLPALEMYLKSYSNTHHNNSTWPPTNIINKLKQKKIMFFCLIVTLCVPSDLLKAAAL